MSTLPPTAPLTSPRRRTQTAAVIRRTVLQPVSALLIVEIIDNVSAAVLRAAGVDDDTARQALALLWSER